MGGVNWFDILPWDIARQQVGWERHRLAARMHDAGFIYAEVGRRLGVSEARAQQMGTDIRNRRRSPVERWLTKGIEFKAPLVGSGSQTAKLLASALEGFV